MFSRLSISKCLLIKPLFHGGGSKLTMVRLAACLLDLASFEIDEANLEPNYLVKATNGIPDREVQADHPISDALVCQTCVKPERVGEDLWPFTHLDARASE